MRANTFRMTMVGGMVLLMTGLLSAQESSARFFRILATNQITITNFTDGVMAWDGQSAGAVATVEVSENLTVSNGWRRYTDVPGDASRGALKVFDNNTPDGMVLIPAGVNSGTDPDVGAYSLTVTNSFYMDATEVTKAQWDTVYNWAITNGYSFTNAGLGKATNHPVYKVNWYDCVKWCNARSQKEGRVPCYTTNGVLYKTGQNDDVACNFSANGYRLPTVTEHRYASRGGLSGKRFPWGDTINHSHANYQANGSTYTYDTSPYTTSTYHPTYNDGIWPYTSPIGSFAANGYGLYDMAGNVWEFCWDASGAYRPSRGGSWYDSAYGVGLQRSPWGPPDSADYFFGFRTVCR